MTISFARHQFPPAIIQHAVRLSLRNSPAAQDVPRVSVVRRSLIVANCLTRSAALAGLSYWNSSSSVSRFSVSLSICSRSSRARWLPVVGANWGQSPYSRIAGLLLFPLRPFRGKLLSTTTEFPFQWRRNRFASRECLLWRLFGRANWLGR